MEPAYFEFFCPVKILCGRKALPNLPYELKQLGSSKPMVITDKGVFDAGLLDKVKAVFEDSDIEIASIYAETPVDSSNKVVNEIARLYKKVGCDGLVALGGGSVIDTAKGANMVISEDTDDLLNLQGVDRITAKMQPFIVIPTTAGTGSEVTAAAVIYNEDKGLKMVFTSNRLYPNVAIIDPVMTMTMPPLITAASGMDAMTHAIEAMYSLQRNPVSDAYATAAIRLVNRYIERAVTKKDDKDARLGMATAALLAGMAFSNSMVCIVHAVAHALGGIAHVPHGIGNAIMLPFGMEYNMDKAASVFAEIAGLLGEDIKGLTAKDAGIKAVERVRKLNKSLNKACGMPITLKEAGVQEDMLPKIAKVAYNDGPLTYNPTEATEEEILALVKRAY